MLNFFVLICTIGIPMVINSSLHQNSQNQMAAKMLIKIFLPLIVKPYMDSWCKTTFTLNLYNLWLLNTKRYPWITFEKRIVLTNGLCILGHNINAQYSWKVVLSNLKTYFSLLVVLILKKLGWGLHLGA